MNSPIFPKVSVIIPAYNSGEYIIDTLNSVYNQTFQDYEIVIVNDGSTDNTQLILELEKELHSEINVISQENQGVSAARNAGIIAAKGDFICFLDSDDKFEPVFLEKMLQKQNETNKDVIFCGYYKWSSNHKFKCIPGSFRKDNVLLHSLKATMPILVVCLLIDKKIITDNNIYFDIGLKFGEDLLFIYKLLSISSCDFVPDYLYHYIYRHNSAMNSIWTEEDYLHDIYAMNKIRSEVSELYTGYDKHEVINQLFCVVLCRKIRFLWKLLKSGSLDDVESYLDNNIFSKEELNRRIYLSGKMNKKLFILLRKNKQLWKLVRFLSRRKKL